jgi:hypothetical protein
MANWALEFDSANMTKNFFSQNLNMAIKTMQNFTLILKLLRKMRKIC